MKQIQLGNSDLRVSNIALGCMRVADKTVDEVKDVIQTALDCGINFFDHADIYGQGKSETIFAQALSELDVKREDIFIQSKLGINQKERTFDFSYDYIIKTTDEILERLNTDYLDILLLHRPDTLMEPEEVARAFKQLHQEGKVRHFGVSNFNTFQVDLLQASLDFKLLVNQVQFSIMHTPMIDEGINMNLINEAGIVRTSGLLESSRLNNITLQAWSPYQYGFFEGVFIDNPKFPELNACMQEIADKYNVSKTTIATAWILKHPAEMQVIVGSMNPQRIQEITKASELKITRKEWYDIYKASGKILP